MWSTHPWLSNNRTHRSVSWRCAISALSCRLIASANWSCKKDTNSFSFWLQAFFYNKKNDKFLFRTNTSLRKEINYKISYSIFMIVVYLKNFFIKLVYLFVLPHTYFLYTFRFIHHNCKSFYNNHHPSLVCQLHKEETNIWETEYVSL